MISRVLRFTTLAKSISYQNSLSSQYASRLTMNNVFHFSDDKKPTPIKSTGIKPIKSDQVDDSVEAQMDPLKPRQGQKPLEEADQGVEPTKFGNTMMLMSALALLLAYAYMEIQVIRSNKKKGVESRAKAKVTGVGKAQIGGQWELLGTDGKPFSSKQLQGKYYLIYFGFTHCPDICPNSLTKLAKAVSNVKKSKQANFFDLQTVFVSVDPDRDNAEKLQKFISVFDPNMIGVTGTNNQDPALRECMKKFKIYASKLEFEDQDDVIKGRKSYTIDHTILTYLMSDTNEYLAHLGGNLGQHDLTSIILQKIKEDKHQKLRESNL